MERSVSVEDFLGGILALGRSGNSSFPKMAGMGQRTESEAAFQEFLKRIPSASALSSQNVDDKANFYGSASNTSLFNFGSAGGASAPSDANIPRVASLEMLRTLVDPNEARERESKGANGAQKATQHSTQQAQLFQPAGQAHPASQAIANGSLPPGPVPMGMPAGMPQATASMAAYQLQQQLQQNPALAAANLQHLQATGVAGLEHLGLKMQPGQSTSPDQQEKLEQRRARRMLSNRESARRSRKRKQEQLHELEKQITALEDRNAGLEEQCKSAAEQFQQLMAEKQRLENENQHMMSIFQQLQKSIGAEKLRLHLPAALGGSAPAHADPMAASADEVGAGGERAEGVAAAAAAASAGTDGGADAGAGGSGKAGSEGDDGDLDDGTGSESPAAKRVAVESATGGPAAPSSRRAEKRGS